MATRIIYGIQAVRQALNSRQTEKVFVQEGLGPKRLGRLAEDLERSRTPVQNCSAADLERMTGSRKHQGVAASVRASQALSEREALEFLTSRPLALILVLDSVQDPRNFGSLLRTANAAGADLVAYARSRNVGLTPVVSKVASGAAEAQLIAEVGNLARFLQELREIGVRVIGTDDSAAASLFDVNLSGPVALVLGAEGAGLRRLTRERCDALVSLPMLGAVESLNVAVAAGVCLYECLRQRLVAPGRTLR
jgi:23S rRNA (guanosine2251-2'-O)-methyltransferase